MSVELLTDLQRNCCQPQVEEDLTLKLTNYVACEILLKVNIEYISNMSLVCRRWHQLTNYDELWQMLLKRDFGEESIEGVESGNFKQAYMDNFLRVRKFAMQMPEKEFLLDLSRKTLSIRLNGLFSPRALAVYIQIKLSNEQIQQVFCKAAEIGCLPVMRNILESPKSDCLNQNDYENALIGAAINGYRESLRLIMQDRRYQEIDHALMIEHAIWFAASCGQVGAIEFLLENQTIESININGSYGLGAAFIEASSRGQIGVMKVIMKHPKFREINIDGFFSIADALIQAAKNKEVRAMQEIMNSPEYQKIRSNGATRSLGTAFIRAAKVHLFDIFKYFRVSREAVSLIINDSRFKEIHVSTIFKALKKTTFIMKAYIVSKLASRFFSKCFCCGK